MAVFVLFKLFFIQFGEGSALRSETQRDAIRAVSIEAERGNVYSSDGKLLATSMPVYDVFMDPVTINDQLFSDSIAALAQKLAMVLPDRNSAQWENHIRNKREKKSRYVRLAEEISFTELQQIKRFPIFNLGKYRGGLIFEQKNYRKMPLGKIAERTIGYDQLRGRTGIEGAFSNYLSGTDGKRLKQKVSNGNWKPISDTYEIEPEDGLDVVTTLNTRMQDVVHHELLKSLEKFEADHGCAILMEVETGAIRAISNLGRTEKGTYFEKRNYGVWEKTEPGSTFKLASVIVALEDGVADSNTIVDTENGYYKIYGIPVKDSNYNGKKGGYGKVTLKKAFEVSSNVGIVKLIYDNYRENPDKYIDRLYNMGLHKKLGVSIQGESTPDIPKPGDQSWSGISLPWVAFGYQVSFTPLQVLSLYNAVANNGKMIKPHFIEEIKKHGRTVEVIETEVLNPAICSNETLGKVRAMMEGVVKQGTATNIQSELVSMAGKTGTCQQNYWKGLAPDYQASFAGYFPAENPKYSCIVVINKPNYHRGYYGSAVAAPVFKAIAESIYLSTPDDSNAEVDQNALTFIQENSEYEFDGLSGKRKFPSLKGLNGSDVLPVLENQGYKVKVQGIGKVQWQYPPAGSDINPNTLIELKLG
jgi:cell division protein FtsI (penicillin-binding protein 3)